MNPSRRPRISGGLVGLACAVFAVALAVVPGGARAATVSLSGSGQMSASFQFLAPNGSTPVATGVDYSLAVPGQYTFLHAFTSNQSALAPLGNGAGAYTFMDSYRFTVDSAAAGSTLVASLGLDGTFNVSNLQLRLYRVPSATTDPIVPGLPAGSQLLTAWQGPNSGPVTITSMFEAVQPGTYILDVAGIANGPLGGTYVGQLNLTPVPLPAAGWLLLSGLGLVARIRRRSPPHP